LILGGARSGKSAFAESLAKGHDRVAYIATALIADDEMRRRVDQHRKRRPKNWITYEADTKLDAAIRSAAKTATLIIVDCITLYVSNLLVQAPGERGRQTFIMEEIEEICATARKVTPSVVMVSNEVGMGVVPDTPLGREFRDVQGKANQIVAAAADEVYFVVAGIAQKIK
jgi:adenosylcobinamide kinase/adenosylcobinamide-phosphate guanylyltransferase